MIILTNIWQTTVEELTANIDEHIAWLEQYRASDQVVAYGQNAARDGGFAIFINTKIEDMDHILEGDPFYRKKLVVYTKLALDVQSGHPDLVGR